MLAATDAIQAGVYEAPSIAALGPQWSAVAAGFAVVIFGTVYITPAGERYLKNLEMSC
jgi:hypothetical protein